MMILNNLASIILRLASDMILIVDDDYDIASLIRISIEKRSFRNFLY